MSGYGRRPARTRHRGQELNSSGNSPYRGRGGYPSKSVARRLTAQGAICDHCPPGPKACDDCQGCVACGKHYHAGDVLWKTPGWCSEACMNQDENLPVREERKKRDTKQE